MTRISPDWLTAPEVRAVMVALGGQAFFVGGCVRNALLVEAHSDIDFATPLLPEKVTTLLEEAGLKAVPTGIDHGTVTAVAGGQGFEITTYRADVETDGRRAVVRFSTEMAEDAARRDFTMNALYADGEGRVIDPLGGLPDLLARRVRFIGNAQARIREDYLRILRFFRFTAWYGNQEIEPEGLAACAALGEGLAGLARERVGAEIRKLLSAPDPAPALAAMAHSGVLARCLPGADTRPMALLVHLEAEAGATPCWLRRLALLGGDITAERLRLSRAEARDLERLRETSQDDATPAVLAEAEGAERALSAVLIRCALCEQPLPDGLLAEISRGAAAVFPVAAADLLRAGVRPGPEMGAALSRMRTLWIASDFSLDKRELMAQGFQKGQQ